MLMPTTIQQKRLFTLLSSFLQTLNPSPLLIKHSTMGFDLDNSQFYPPFSALDRFLTGQTHFQEFQAQSNTSNDQKEGGLSEFSSPYYGVVADQHQYVYGSPNSWLLPGLQGDHEPYSTTFCHDHSFHEGVIMSNNNDTHRMISQGNNNSHDRPENGVRSDEKTSRRARKGSSSTLVKRKWTDEEDRTLAKMVEDYGMKKWACIANKLDGRSAKQCRERWQNHLRPDIKKDSWTEEEEKIFVEVHKKLGNRWSEIAKRIPGRTENAVKNHWNAAKRRRRQETTLRKKKVSQNLPKPSSLLQDYIESNNYGYSRGNITHNNQTIIPSTTISEVSTLTPPRPLEPLEYEHSNLPLINENNCDEERVFMLNLFNATHHQPLGLLPPLPPLIWRDGFRDQTNDGKFYECHDHYRAMYLAGQAVGDQFNEEQHATTTNG